jgi:hypothetical protein
VPATTADILIDFGAPPPFIAAPVSGAALGLAPGDIVDAISDGVDPLLSPHLDYFSVGPGTSGVPGSGVTAEILADTPPGATPGHLSDIFIAGLFVPLGTNMLAPAGLGWTPGTGTGDEDNTGLVNPGDNVNAYELLGASAVVFFSLAPTSPTLAALGATPADILVSGVGSGGPPVIFLPGAALGLPPGADLDALALFAPAGLFLGPGTIEYSISSGTAPLVPGISGADILGLPVGPPAVAVVHTAASIGLAPGDELDALDVGAIPEPSAFLFGALVCGIVGLAWGGTRIWRAIW